jgi:putative ABC transport system permease protein
MIKNFLFVLQRFKTSSILNILGLTTAFASFLIIMMQVNFEYGFEKYHPNADRIYRIDLKNSSSDGWFPILARPFTQAIIQSSPQILAGTLINPYLGDFYITVEDNGMKKGFKEQFVTCNTPITQVFNFKMIEGSADCLNNPDNVIIPRSTALRLFGNQSAVGKSLELSGYLWTKQNGGLLVVGGVYEDFPDNTQLNNYIYTAIADDYTVTDWKSQNYFCYVLLDKDANPEAVAENFNKTFDFSILGYESQSPQSTAIRLFPLQSVYFDNRDPSGQLIKSGSSSTPLILLTIGLLIIAIAVINYTNFTMALSPRRMRSINTHKILGGTEVALRINIIAESVLLCGLSFLLAVFTVYFIAYNRLLPFISIDIYPTHNLPPVFITGAIALATGLIAGIRPAFYMTSLPPVMALNGNFGLSPAGKRLRIILIGFQFFISIALIISAFFVYKQNRFMQKYTLGYNTNQIALTELPQSIARENQKAFIAQLKDNPDIMDIAFSHQKFGASDTYRGWGGTYNDEPVHFISLSVSWNFPAVMGIQAIEGRLPKESDENEQLVFYIINQTMQKAYNMQPENIIDIPWMSKDRFDNGKILGIVNDVKFTSLRNQVENMAFVFNDHNGVIQPWSYIRIRDGADIRSVVKYIEKSIVRFDPAYPAKIEFYDEVFDALYKKEINTEYLINLFGSIAILIAIVGIFGLVMFECEYKRKEIGLRKVMGSTEMEILRLFNRLYLRIFAVCFLAAVPAGYYIVNRWLENFAYKTAVHWWESALIGLPVLLIIVATVSVQSWHSATINPTKALNSE